jgi:hypothetical protein
MSRIAQWLRGAAAVAVAAALAAPAAAAEPKENLDAAIQAAAPAVLKELHDKGYKNVGVLKFLVAESDGVLRSNLGPLNRTLADRFEVALTLLLDDEDKLGIIVGASDGVAKAGNTKADQRTEQGRKELFTVGADENLFNVPWKKRKPGEKLLPDAFLTGEAQVSKDRKTITVKVQLFDKKAPEKVCQLAEFTALNDTRTLTELGLTYVTRGGAKIGEAVKSGEAVVLVTDKDKDKDTPGFAPPLPTPEDTDKQRREEAQGILKALNKSPVELEILYDGQRQVIHADAGGKFSSNTLLRVDAPRANPDPKKKTEVAFRLTNRGEETYGVVLRVNGLNTIYKQRQNPAECWKWILKKDESVTVTGFQSNNKEAYPFEVFTPVEWKESVMDYGDSPGTFDLIVFRGYDKKEQPAAFAMNDRTYIARGAMVLTGEPSATDLASFKSQLRDESKKVVSASTKGGIVGHAKDSVKNPVKEVEFHPFPDPVFSTTIRYFELPK